MTDPRAYAARHALEALHDADPPAFAAALARTAEAGAALPRPPDRETAPAPVFRPLQTRDEGR